MRKIAALILLGAAYYIAGMYRQFPLMLLALMGVVLLVLLFILSRSLIQGVEINFAKHQETVLRGKKQSVTVRVENSGQLPLKRVRIELRMYDNEGMLVKKLKGIKSGAGRMELEICLEHCGIFRLSICQLYVYDYLSVFCAKRRIENKELEIIALPDESIVSEYEALGDSEQTQESVPKEQRVKNLGSENRELRQVREYQYGDSKRYVHWNQSAKTEKLWIKEYEHDNDSYFDLLLDLRLMQDWDSNKQDRFYEAVSSIIREILQGGFFVRVHWYDKSAEAFELFAIENTAQYRSLFIRLYNTRLFEADDIVDKAYLDKEQELGERCLHVSLDLKDLKEGLK